MGKFEDEIKKKLESGDFTPDTGLWDKLSSKLNEQPPASDFEKKIKETFESGEIPMSSNSWENFEQNSPSNNFYEKRIKNKFEEGNYEYQPEHWEAQQSQLHYSNLSKFEKAIHKGLSSNKIKYNPNHWKAMEKMLNHSSKKWLYRTGAAAVILFLIGGLASNLFNKDDRNITGATTTNITSPNKQPLTHHQNLNNASALDFNKKSIGKKVNKIIPFKKYSTADGFTNRNGNFNKFDNSSTVLKSVNNGPIGSASVNNNISENSLVTPKNLEVVQQREQSNFNQNIIGIHPKQIEFCTNLDLEIDFNKPAPKRKQPHDLNHGSTILLNFWDNPAVTGMYGKHHISSVYKNGWERVKNDEGYVENNLNQPVNSIVGYEHQFKNKPYSIGGYFHYNLNNNWNIRKYNLSASYNKALPYKHNIRIGAAAEFESNNLAVNKLTLREKAINSDFIFTTDLGKLKSKTQYFINYNIGAFLNHKNYFISYTLEDVSKMQIENENDELITEQEFIFGLHFNPIKSLTLSPMFKYNKDLFVQYSPSLAFTFNKNIFGLFEYQNLTNYNSSLGYCWNNKLKLRASFSLKQLTDLQKSQLNLNNFNERNGFIEFGVNYLIR